MGSGGRIQRFQCPSLQQLEVTSQEDGACFLLWRVYLPLRLLVELTALHWVFVHNHEKVRQWLTATRKTDSVNKTQIKISLSLYPLQITSWIGWTVARMTFTLSQSLKPSGRISTSADTDADRVIGQNDPLQLTSWPLTPQWPCDKNYQHDVQQTSCLKKIKPTLIIPDHSRPPQITPDILTRRPEKCIS